MKEAFLLAPGVNSGELMKSLALQGVSCFNLRICNCVELAACALARSGIVLDKVFLTAEEEASLVRQAIKGIGYFNNTQYADIERIVAAIQSMRRLVGVGDEAAVIAQALGKGSFKAKNAALLQVYQAYKGLLQREGKLDGVSVLRMALEQAESLGKVIILKEFPLAPLERALAEKLAVELVETNLLELFKLKQCSTLELGAIKRCYGTANEVEAIISDIYASGVKLDQCTVAVTDGAAYGQLFLDYGLKYEVPVSFGCGIAISNSRPAELLRLYGEWVGDDTFSKQAFNNMLESRAFDSAALFALVKDCLPVHGYSTLKRLLIDLRLSNNLKVNMDKYIQLEAALQQKGSYLEKGTKDYAGWQREMDCLPALKGLVSEFALPLLEFLDKYTVCRQEQASSNGKLLKALDYGALATIQNEIKTVIAEADIKEAIAAIPRILAMRIGYENSCPGKLHITDINGALSGFGERLYVAGLAASKFPGAPKENFLLLDEDIANFGPEATYLLADNAINTKKKLLRNLIRLAKAKNCHLQLSYAGLNTAELKEENASSLLFELYKEWKGSTASFNDFERDMVKVGYFDPELALNRKVGQKYNMDMAVEAEARSPEPQLNFKPDQFSFSATALERFFKCPRLFLLRSILEIGEPEEQDDFTIVSAIDFGNLAHGLMEKLAEYRNKENRRASYEEFMGWCREHFDNAMKAKPVPVNYEEELKEFLEVMEYAYISDPDRKVVLGETKIEATHESGIKLNGYPDRVELLEDGSYLIVDYKTGKNVIHKENDLNTCLQAVIYAFLMESQGYRIAGCEYRYLREKKNVFCKYDDEIKQAFGALLTQVSQALKDGAFGVTEEAEHCKYCKYGAVCGKE